MPETYGNHETAALIVLMLENREITNPELTKDYGIDLRKAGRDRLNKAGLLKSQTDKAPYVHQITEAGIAWCGERLVEIPPPTRSGPLVRAMFDVLRLLVRHLRQQGVRLVDVLHPGDLESLIRAAYRELSVKPQDWVRLAELRPRLNGAGKDEVDQVLLAMTRTGFVHLAPDSDRSAVTDADRIAAVRIGKEDKHLVAIEES